MSKKYGGQLAFVVLGTILLATVPGHSQEGNNFISSMQVQRNGFDKPRALIEKWGDQGDGTYVNPILPGDFSDTDAIRVEQTFYMIFFHHAGLTRHARP